MSEPQPIAHCPECDKPIYSEWEWELHKHPCTDDLVEDGYEDEEEHAFDCHMDRHGNCGKAGSEECEFECPYRNVRVN
jgi:hypothetical protein